MLQHINIKNFAIIDNLELELKHGMTVITGETGAGKSIVIDALDIALGDRADSKMIRHGCDKCEINLSFDVTHIGQARQWLVQQELSVSEHECLIRRVISKEGRSRNYINGTTVTVQQLKELGELLVHVHGQHQHHALLKRDQQRLLLDYYLKNPALLSQVSELYQQWKNLQLEIAELEQQTGTEDAKVTLLQYQIEELHQLQLTAQDVEALHAEHTQLANAENILQTCQRTLTALTENPEGSILQGLHHVLAELTTLNLEKITPIQQLLTHALIEAEEAATELKHLYQTIEINDERLHWVENRLSQIYELARKHKVKPEALYAHQQLLSQQLDDLVNADERLQQARQQQEKIFNDYQAAAQQLSQQRRHAATQLGKLISKNLPALGMPGGVIEIAMTKLTAPTASGLDHIDFTVSTNPGQPLQSLSKVASGGELSRISLAIQVITAQSQTTPSLVFDEVDVGIGGGTAEIVGQLLRDLGNNAQVLCITHLPQVAAQGHHHLQIHKTPSSEGTISTLTWLQKDERVQELARMLGGIKITQQTLAHAQEMLDATLLAS
jgi:DNA repair protein RecN (Recombination protein N)